MAENTVNPWISAGLGAGTSVANTIIGALSARAQRKWSERMMDKQNDWSLEMWNKTNEYNDPKNQVARLEMAGLNPLYYGLDGSSANGLESAQPLNYERMEPSLANPTSDFIQAAQHNKQMEVLDAQKQNIEADTNLKKSQTKGEDLSNEFLERTKEARIEAETLKNELTKADIKQINKKVDEIEQNIKESEQRCETEIVKRGLMEVQKNLYRAQANEIAALLPYRQNLMDAQTEAERMAAAVDFTHNLYEAGLIDGGYIDALCEKAKSDARTAYYTSEASKHYPSKAEADAYIAQQEGQIDEWKKRIKTGTYFDESKGSWFGRVGKHIANSIMEFSSTVSESLGPLSGIVSSYVGGRAAGTGVGKGVERGVGTFNKNSGSNSQFGPSFTYGSDGRTNWSK